MKAAQNMDTPPKQGSQASENSFLRFTNVQVSHTQEDLGFCLDHDNVFITSSVANLRDMESERLKKQTYADPICLVFDKEEKEMLEEDVVNKLILNSVCRGIIDEVIYLCSAYRMDGNTTPKTNKSSSLSKVTKRSKKKNRTSRSSK
jgi:hypothetical protein